MRKILLLDEFTRTLFGFHALRSKTRNAYSWLQNFERKGVKEKGSE